jgi:hypothetical protein
MSKYRASIYKLFPMYVSTVAVLLGVVGTLAIITMDLSVHTIWAKEQGYLINGFWSFPKIRAFHLGEIIAIICIWLQVLRSGK